MSRRMFPAPAAAVPAGSPGRLPMRAGRPALVILNATGRPVSPSQPTRPAHTTGHG
jgi:hypothetical protein